MEHGQREKAGSTAPLEEEEKAAQQHSLLHLNVSKVASTKRMPPEGGENKQSVRTSWQLEKKQTVQLNSTTGSTGRLPLPPHRHYSRPVKRIIKGAIKRRQISEQQWDWPEGRAGRAGLLQLCEHLGARRGGWLWRHAFCLQR